MQVSLVDYSAQYEIYLYQSNINHLARPKGEGLREQISLVQRERTREWGKFQSGKCQSHNVPPLEPRK